MNNDAIYIGSDLHDKYLAHFGKGHLDGGKSGRYPWGSGERPRQSEERPRRNLKDLSKSMVAAAGRVGGRVVNMGMTGAKKAVPVVGKVQATESAETKEAMKKRLLARGNVSEILTNADLFTTNELNDFINRQRALSNIKGMVPKKKTFGDRAKNAANAINTLVQVYDTGQKVWARMKPGLEKVGIIEKKPENVSYGSQVARAYLDHIKSVMSQGNVPIDKLNEDLEKYAKLVGNVTKIDAAAHPNKKSGDK